MENIDRCKAIDDEQGHARGGAVLRDVAYEIRKQLRSFEPVYRLGGEESAPEPVGAAADMVLGGWSVASTSSS